MTDEITPTESEEQEATPTAAEMLTPDPTWAHNKPKSMWRDPRKKSSGLQAMRARDGSRKVNRSTLQAARMSVVAALLVQGYTLVDIEAELPERGIINHMTGEPFGYDTLKGDKQKIEAEWQEKRVESLADDRNKMLAELDLLTKVHWANNDYEGVLDVIKTRAQILGLTRPESIAMIYNNIEAVDWDKLQAKYNDGADEAELLADMIVDVEAADVVE